MVDSVMKPTAAPVSFASGMTSAPVVPTPEPGVAPIPGPVYPPAAAPTPDPVVPVEVTKFQVKFKSGQGQQVVAESAEDVRAQMVKTYGEDYEILSIEEIKK